MTETADSNYRALLENMLNGFAYHKMVFDEGADAYLVKPVKPEELLMLIEAKLKNK
jgi:CheY-like chemotaxis protein